MNKYMSSSALLLVSLVLTVEICLALSDEVKNMKDIPY